MTEKRLAEGQLSNSKSTLYTVPTNQRGALKALTLVNTDTVPRTVNVYVTVGVNSRRVCPKNLNIDPGNMVVLDEEIIVNEGEKIEADASAANVVDYVLSGEE